MTFQEIFNEYYTLYRADNDIPSVGDDEWMIAINLCNSAINRWDRVDGVLWNELFGNATPITIAADTKTYEIGDEMRTPGGNITITDINGGDTVLQLVSPEKAQTYTADSQIAFFTGDPNNGFILNIPTPATNWVGGTINFVYYKKPTTLQSTETGTTVLEMSDPYFCVHHMLASRYRANKKLSYYDTAFRDAEEALKNMQHRNMMGTNQSPFKIEDTSGTVWGE